MIKIKKLQYSLKVLFGINRSNETAYTNTIVTDDGTYVYLINPYDPNTQDVQIEYSQVVEPTSASITDLVDILRCWILEGLDKISIYEDSIDVLGADCNALQNVNNDLYWRGQLLSGGGGSIVTDGDTISGSGTLLDPLMTTLHTDKDSIKGVGSSVDPFYVENFNNYFQIEEHFLNGVIGTPISVTTPAGFTNTTLSGNADHPGIIRLTAGTIGGGIISASNTISVRLGGTSLATSPILLDSKHNKYEAVVRFNSFALSSGYNVNFRLGFINDPFANGGDGFFIGQDTDLFLGIPAGELRLIKQISGGATGYAPAIPFTFTAGQQYRISIEINNATSEYSVVINGVTIMTNITNPIGTFPTGLVSPSVNIQHRTTIVLVTPHQLDIDYLKYKVEYPTKQLG